MAKNILMIMYGKGIGGAELQFIELAKYLSQRHTVKVISLGGDNAFGGDIPENLDIEVCPYTNRWEIFKAILFAMKLARKLSPQVIISTSFIGNLCAFLVYKIYASKKLVSMQTVSRCMGNPALDKFILARFHHLIAGANDIREYLLNHGMAEHQIQVVHNWVDFSSRKVSKSPAEIRKAYKLDDRFLIGCVARLHIQKGHVYLVRAMKELPENCLLVLVGDGPERKELEEETKRLGLNQKILFLGEIKGNDYNDILASFDIFVLPSLFEGLPRVLLDTMYVGVPIIATDVNGNREAIKHNQTGILIPPADPLSLKESIEELMGDVEKQKMLVTNAKSSVVRDFEMQSQLQKIEGVILDA